MNELLPDVIVALNPIGDFFSPVLDLLQGVLAWLESWTNNWGIAIILLTIIVRILIFPLTWKQFRSAQNMQALQPKIKELQRKYKGDKQRLQQETMKLYQEHRVNPFASCLPLLLQLPIFISLYYAIRGEEALQGATFLWFTLGSPDPYYILLIVYVASQLVSTELMLTPESPAQQKWMMRAMPLIFVFVLRSFPSGLFVYWITTNLWSIGQQATIKYLVKKHPPKPVDPSTRKESRFMQAMNRAQEQAEVRRGGAPAGTAPRRSASGAQRAAGKRDPQQRAAGKGGARPSGERPAKKQGSRAADEGVGRPRSADSSGKPAAGRRQAGGAASTQAGGRSQQAGSGQGRGKKRARPADERTGKPVAKRPASAKRPAKPKQGKAQAPKSRADGPLLGDGA